MLTEPSILISVAAAIIVPAAVLCLYFFSLLKRAKEEKETLAKKYEVLESRVSGMRLETLESKLNPHLFKNILNSIQSHAYQTYFALDKLAQVLDYILYEAATSSYRQRTRSNSRSTW
jgi:histidine kinase